jgi:hypothetical protein
LELQAQQEGTRNPKESVMWSVEGAITALANPIQLCLLVVVALTSFAYIYSSRGLPRSTEEPERKRGYLSFRLRGVPIDWADDEGELQSFLEKVDATSLPKVKSLAREIDGSSCTATVTFRNVPTQFRHGRPVPSPVEAPAAGARYLTLDDDFHGITTLFAPPPDDHTVE